MSMETIEVGVCCDHCDESVDLEIDARRPSDFELLFRDALEAEGWGAVHFEGYDHHLCPECLALEEVITESGDAQNR